MEGVQIASHQNADSLLEYGFTNHHSPTLYLYKALGSNISFNMSVNKNTKEINIDVLDENFLQPYDYQYLILIDKHNQAAKRVKKKVEDILNSLQEDGVITGYKSGMYI
ncbi:hypothetical protein ACI2JA_03400 [Alkalihalobacillus sp. NPDC078783]